MGYRRASRSGQEKRIESLLPTTPMLPTAGQNPHNCKCNTSQSGGERFPGTRFPLYTVSQYLMPVLIVRPGSATTALRVLLPEVHASPMNPYAEPKRDRRTDSPQTNTQPLMVPQRTAKKAILHSIQRTRSRHTDGVIRLRSRYVPRTSRPRVFKFSTPRTYNPIPNPIRILEVKVSGATGTYAIRINGIYEIRGAVGEKPCYCRLRSGDPTGQEMWLCCIKGDGRWAVQKEVSKGTAAGYAMSFDDRSDTPVSRNGPAALWTIYNKKGWQEQQISVEGL